MFVTFYLALLINFVFSTKSEEITLDKYPNKCHEVSDKYMLKDKTSWLVFLLYIDCSDEVDSNQRSTNSSNETLICLKPKSISFSDKTDVHTYPLEHRQLLEST